MVKKAWVNVPWGQVHLRYAGSGPPVLLLHDSPRSSVLHVPVLEALADEFTAIALDTPGYGLSTPLPMPQPEITDFAAALARTVSALDVGPCPIYAFHTSSKIALELAVQTPDCATVFVLDGLSIPADGPDPAFIRSYMQPFEPSVDGSHVAAGYTRVRDFHRFFPWFAHSAATRMPLELPDAHALHVYATDLFMAGPHYRDAYSAAMRYRPLPAVQRLRSRTIFMCREDDVLYSHLDRLPQLPPRASIERLGADRDRWRERLRELFRTYPAPRRSFAPPDPLAAASDGEQRQGYVDTLSGQLRVRRQGRQGARPVLLLHDVPGSSAQLSDLMAAIAVDRTVLASDAPGLGESSAIDEFDLDRHAASLEALIDALALDSVDVYAELLAGPLALALATRVPDRVHKLVLDGLVMPGSAQRRRLWKQYCPRLEPRSDGTHLIGLWHQLRDQELAWPWYARTVAAIRPVDPQIGPMRLHAMLVDVMKQPQSYGAAALAALDCDVRSLTAVVQQPVLLMQRPGDPRYAAVDSAARQLRHATLAPRPPGNSELAQLLHAFLDA